ncbi:MAG: hypothetical protein LBF15_04630 [Candidatus Peribacteria bacterium]|jgi:hypothetical protein|nr:hypothetical protein [Candidatus Peribacteria bacterium]
MSARVVKPKAKPGLPFKEFEITTRVIGIVILKRKIHKIPKIGFVAQNPSKMDEIISELIHTFSNPNLSAKIPPKAFPKTTQRVNIKPRVKPIFQGNSTINPIKERIKIESKIKKQIKIINLFFLLLSVFSNSSFGSFVIKIRIITTIANILGYANEIE